ncbi:hypothetical protein F4604DRAFT_1935437 [Suillus subluteus]|nr:hypothetical protein F4604DRAFT_1935437 [Suillus subluteus]
MFENPNPNPIGGNMTTQERFDTIYRIINDLRPQMVVEELESESEDVVAARERLRTARPRWLRRAEQRKNPQEPGKSFEECPGMQQEKGRKEATAPATGETSLSQKPGTRCVTCTIKNRDCSWHEAPPGNKAKTCDACRRLKDKCVAASVPPAKAPSGMSKGEKRLRAEGTPSPKATKGRQRSPLFLDDDIEEIPNPETVIADEWVDYNDLGWAVAASNIVGELTWMSELREKSFHAAESSSAAIEKSSAAMERFLTEQMTFQALLLEGLKSGFQGTVDENSKETNDIAPSAGDVEMDA